MRIFFSLGILTACLIMPAIGYAADTGWYVGYGQGQTRASDPPPYSSQTIDYEDSFGGMLSHESADQNSTGKRIEGGYWFNPYVGLQGGLVDLGQYSASAKVNAGHQIQFCHGPSCNFDFIDAPHVKVRGVPLVVTGAWPFADGFELIGRVGLFRSRATYDDSGNMLLTKGGVPPAQYSIVRNSTGTTYGVGLGWNFATHWEVLLGWDEYRGIGDDRLFGTYVRERVIGNFFTSVFTLFGKFDVRLLTLGIQYHF